MQLHQLAPQPRGYAFERFLKSLFEYAFQIDDLGWGKLTGKIRRGQPAQPGTRAHDIADTGPKFEEERLFRIVDAMDEVAAQTGKTHTQIALNWLLHMMTCSMQMR